MRRWYNCWLAHSWKPWEQYKMNVGFFWQEWKDMGEATYQERKCRLCGKVQQERVS